MRSASLLIFYNIVLNKNKLDHIISEAVFLHTLRMYMKTEEVVHRVTSTLIIIHLNMFNVSASDYCAKEILTTLTSWLKGILEDSSRVKNLRPDATAVIRGFKKLATVQIFSTMLKENQYFMSLSKSNCWTKQPTAAVHFIKLLTKLNLIGAQTSKENKRKSLTTTIQKCDMNLLIIGSGGAGKSSLGNSIIGKRVFKVSDGGDETTAGVTLATGSFNGRTLNVVDTPSVGNNCSIKHLCQNLNKTFSFSLCGFHAILLVIQYGFSNFNQHDLRSIEGFKKIFGRYFLRDYGVLVFTCGDYFRKEHKTTHFSFEDWLTLQRGLLHDLITECKNRVVLFDNLTCDETQCRCQMSGLIHLVDKMRLSDYRFSSEHFQRAKDSRDELIQWECDRHMHRNISEEVKILEQDLKIVSLNIKTDIQTCELQKILEKAHKLADRVASLRPEGTENNYISLSHRVQEIVRGAENQKKLLRGIAYNKRKLKQKCP